MIKKNIFILLTHLSFYSLLFCCEVAQEFCVNHDFEAQKKLINAAKSLDNNLLKEILAQKNIDVNYQNKYGHTALMYAILSDRSDNVNLLLEAGAEINLQNNKGNHSLIIAVLHNNPEIVKFLLNKKVNLGLKNNDKESALDIAIKNKNIEIIKLFALANYDFNSQNNLGQNALTLALAKKNPELIKLIFKDNFGVNYKEIKNTFNGSFNDFVLQVIKLSIAKNIDIDLKNLNNETLYLDALRAKNIDLVRFLINKKVKFYSYNSILSIEILELALNLDKDLFFDFLLLIREVNIADASNNNALMLIAAKRYDLLYRLFFSNDLRLLKKLKSLNDNDFLKFAKKLIINKINLDARNNCQETALLIACESGFENLIRLLLENNAQVDKAIEDGTTPLLYACHNNYINIVKILLDHKADVNLANKRNARALTVATSKSNKAMIELLIEYNAELDFEHAGHPLIFAISSNDIELAKKLLEKKANPNIKVMIFEGDQVLIVKKGDMQKVLKQLSARSRQYQYLLHNAVDAKNPQMISLLLKHGANIDQKSYNGQTPLILAAQLGYIDCVKVLLKNGANTEIIDSNNQKASSIAGLGKHKEIVALIMEHKLASES